MADPVSSVAYAIEAALRALHGDLSLLLPTMGLVVAVIALIITNYHQLVARFPEGGGAAAAAGKAFGEGWAFVPIGALIVDFVLTIAISVAAGASALIEYVPSLAPDRIPLALLLLVAVAGLTWYGHIGRAAFALMTLAFVGAGIAVIAGGIHAPVANVGYSQATSGRPPVLAVLLAFPVAMALATGVEAPSSAIAQLGQLDDAGRRRFGRITLWLTLAIVGTLTLGLTAAAVHLKVGIPAPEQHPDRQPRPGQHKPRRLRLLPAGDGAATARCGQLLVSGRPGLAQGSVEKRDRTKPRRRRPPRMVRTGQPPPHPLLGRRRVPDHLGACDHSRRST